jgi:inner membrane protein
MDPLTHTLVGANLAATPLGSKTRLAAAALVIGANLPDADSILYFIGYQDLALGFRRGWTHGVLALAVLPVVLTALLILYARLRPDPERAVDRRWLLALSALGILTHPFLDWLNNYGMRWLMPFRGTWFYGDAVFIMDPWLWLILGGAWLAGRSSSRPMLATWAVFSLLLAWVVARRQPAYLLVIAIVAVVLLLALLWRVKRSLAIPALAIACVYVGARLVIHELTVREVRREIGAERLMASPHPLDPTRWDVVAEVGSEYRYGQYTWLDRTLRLETHRIPVAKPSREWDAARRDPSVRGFMTWVRFPWYEVDERPDGTHVFVRDARYAVRRGNRGFGGVEVTIPRAE